MGAEKGSNKPSYGTQEAIDEAADVSGASGRPDSIQRFEVARKPRHERNGSNSEMYCRGKKIGDDAVGGISSEVPTTVPTDGTIGSDADNKSVGKRGRTRFEINYAPRHESQGKGAGATDEVVVSAGLGKTYEDPGVSTSAKGVFGDGGERGQSLGSEEEGPRCDSREWNIFTAALPL